MDLSKVFSSAQIARARVRLENAKVKTSQDSQAWLETIRFETLFASSSTSVAGLVSKSIQACPKAGNIFAHAILTDHRTYRKSRVVEALKRCPDDFHVLLAIARTFWSDRKFQKAREWFGRAMKVNPDWGKYLESQFLPNIFSPYICVCYIYYTSIALCSYHYSRPKFLLSHH
jgi:pre-mRNA-processing factor 6